MNKKTLNLSQNTFGSSPACFYLVDLLNKHQGSLYRKLHSNHTKMKELLNQLYKSWQNKTLSTQNFSHILNLKRDEFKNSTKDLFINTIEANKDKENVDYNLINEIINVYSNVMLSEINKMRREAQYTTEAMNRSLQKARNTFKNQKDTKVLPKLFNASGVLEHFKHPYESVVCLDSPAKATILELTPFKDPVSNEELMKRSIARRQKKKNLK